MRFDRRQLLRAMGWGSVAAWMPRNALSREHLPGPDFSRVRSHLAALRPYRRGRFRIELEEVAGKLLIHNYGHGGAGVTLSWGVAEEAADLLKGRLNPGAGIAVLGAGVNGLYTARVLQERGHPVSLFAESF